MFQENACVKHLISQDNINKTLKCTVKNCSIYNIRLDEIHGKMHVNKYYNRYLHYLYTYHCKVLI